ncbi:MAG: thioredoxin family protein [Promethearchaeota archaeon]
MPENGENSKIGVKSMARRLEDAITASPEETLANGTLNELSDSSYMNTVRTPRTAIVEFYTSNCPYCRQMTPVLDALASDYQSHVYFAKINIDEVKGVAEKFDVEGVPLLVAFKKGNPVARMEGLRSRDVIDDWVDSIHKGFRPTNLESGAVTRITISDLSGGSRGSI